MADEQDRAEALDDDAEPEPLPDHLLGAQAYGAAGAEPHADEPVARRAAREEPEQRPIPAGVEDDDPTLHDVATERESPRPAEEAAMHVVGEGGPVAPDDLEDDGAPSSPSSG